MERKEGEVPLGFLDTMRKIVREEGPKALFNGGLTRVLRVSPQFGKLKLACALSELASGVWVWFIENESDGCIQELQKI